MRRRQLSSLVLDLVAVAVFVVIGRANHHHGLGLSGLVSTAWPFVSGLAVGWLVVTARRADGSGLRAGAAVWLSTVTLGMVLRVLGGQGIAVSFVVVALVFVGIFLLGWRTAAISVARHQRRGASLRRPA